MAQLLFDQSICERTNRPTIN